MANGARTGFPAGCMSSWFCVCICWQRTRRKKCEISVPLQQQQQLGGRTMLTPCSHAAQSHCHENMGTWVTRCTSKRKESHSTPPVSKLSTHRAPKVTLAWPVNRPLRPRGSSPVSLPSAPWGISADFEFEIFQCCFDSREPVLKNLVHISPD